MKISTLLRVFFSATILLSVAPSYGSFDWKSRKTAAESIFKDMRSFETTLPKSTKAQNSANMLRNAVFCSLIAGFVSPNNSLGRVAFSAAASAIGSGFALYTLHTGAPTPPEKTSGDKVEPSKKMTREIIAIIAYLFGQNAVSIIDFLRDATYRKNVYQTVKDFFFGNWEAREYASIIIRNAFPLGMHYTPAGQALHDKVSSLLDLSEEKSPESKKN